MKNKDKEIREDALKRIKDKIYSYSNTIREEYDIMELIEDNIKELFSCDLDCSTCNTKEQGQCMQGFKKANLYFLRKLYLDETTLLEFTSNISEMIDLVVETNELLKKEKRKLLNKSKDKYREKFEEAKRKREEDSVPSFYI